MEKIGQTIAITASIRGWSGDYSFSCPKFYFRGIYDTDRHGMIIDVPIDACHRTTRRIMGFNVDHS